VVKALDVLVVDDDVAEACAVARALRHRHAVRMAIGLREAVHEIAHRVPDVIIAASEMPPYRGDALLAMVAAEHPSVKRILFKHARMGRPTMAAPLPMPVAAHLVLQAALDPERLLALIDEEHQLAGEARQTGGAGEASEVSED
jgi:DNA-binding NtrC family response regulator